MVTFSKVLCYNPNIVFYDLAQTEHPPPPSPDAST